MTAAQFPLYLALLWGLLASCNAASSCSTTLTPTSSIRPTVASGYQMALIATGLTKPRSLQFDSSGNLLVVQQGAGIVNLALQDDGGTCLSVKSSKDIIENSDVGVPSPYLDMFTSDELTSSQLNHGIALSPDGKTLYASSAEAAFSWPYDASSSSITGPNTTLVTNMSTSDHTTRTLLLSHSNPDLLLISRGSTSNVDPIAEDITSGHSQLKAFSLSNLSSSAPYNYNTAGLRLGWGLRNSVGVVEHPLTGGIYSVENSVDQIQRDGKDVHQDNPGEEMNFHGYLNGTAYPPQGSNYGYPFCFSAWAPTDLPQNANLTVGSPFQMGDMNSTNNDTYCDAQTIPARLTFQAHQAPIDMKFNNSGTEAWVSFHGSWDRTNPVGYKVAVIPFENGEPVAKSDNNTAATDVFANVDNGACPGSCFRPAGLAFDAQGRLYVASDASGELYVVVKEAANVTGTPTGSGGGSATSSATVSGGSASATATAGSSSEGSQVRRTGWMGAVIAGLAVAVGWAL